MRPSSFHEPKFVPHNPSFFWNERDRGHIVVQNILLAATVPFDDQSRPILVGHGALVSLIVLPANLIADF